jgi:hypothetical protein
MKNISFTDSILFTTTCEGKIKNVSYKKEGELVIDILYSIEDEILDWEILDKTIEGTHVDIIKINCKLGIIKIPNISDKSDKERAEEFIDIFNSTIKNKAIDNNILSIGCNYGEYMSKEYLKMITPIKKSNRGRKKKTKKPSTRKRIGNGNYFNSQITITLKDPEKLEEIKDIIENKTVDIKIFTHLKSCMYHVKIYTNGKFQIPFVRDEDVYTVKGTVDKAIDIIKIYKGVKIVEEEECDIEYIKSIMKNYRFSLTEEFKDTLIDIKKLRKMITIFKLFCENESIETYKRISGYADKEINTFIEDFKEYKEVLNKRSISLVKYNNDNYTGFILKFSTPRDENLKKETTAAIFDSNKINLYGCNTKEESEILKDILLTLINIGKEHVLYPRN